MSQDHYASSTEHLLAELERIDLLIRLQVSRSRELQAADREFQGLYISEQQVDKLLGQRTGMPKWATAPAPFTSDKVRDILCQMERDIARRKEESLHRGITLRLEDLVTLFTLNPDEVDTLLICLAPEFDLRYELLYAYLQDDVTKKRPSVDLVLNLLSPTFEAKLAARSHFMAGAPLMKNDLLYLFNDPSIPEPPLLGKYLKVDDRLVGYLNDADEIDTRLLPHACLVRPGALLEDLILPARVKANLALMIRKAKERGQKQIFYFLGPYGVGKQTTAEALCRELGKKLLHIDLDHLVNVEGADFDKTVKLLYREALLQDAAVYWHGLDILLSDDRRSLLKVFLRDLEQRAGVTFLAGQTTWEPVDALHTVPFARIEFTRPVYRDRIQLWRRFLGSDTPVDAGVDLSVTANKFRFSGGQIKDSAATARNLARWRDPDNGRVDMGDLHAACRLQSNRKLAELAQKITPHCRWTDLVLPADRLRQLREIRNYVKYRALVYDAWGFERKLSLGKGLNVLFAGPSGTGKTMAAEIMVGELGLDLYKIDLSTVVSKYIGETEKNLSRIFSEAETSNAVLFFDEADALFGKRSEVRDAHDRYANIEISYLLQKMEEYEGVVILATNLRKNMDDAFVRRMHFTVEFPFPGERDRLRIWEKIWPKETPRSSDLDLAFVANRIEIAGGNIRNIALAAAFLAADDGNVVNMSHVIQATRREFQKMGKVMTGGQFGEFAGQVTRRE